MNSYCDPGRRHDVVLWFDVSFGNPNGDPEAGNFPRLDPDTQAGLVTDVALKRKIRDYMDWAYGDEPGYRIFIQDRVSLNTWIERAYQMTEKSPIRIRLDQFPRRWAAWLTQLAAQNVFAYTPDVQWDAYHRCLQCPQYLGHDRAREQKLFLAVRQAIAQATQSAGLAARFAEFWPVLVGLCEEQRQPWRRAQNWLLEQFWDIRLFGAVLSTGPNAGQVRGPVQLTFARSVDPVTVIDVTLTRKAQTAGRAPRRSPAATYGRRPVVSYGLYVCHGFYQPWLGLKAGVTAEDLRRLWEALRHLFDHDRSAARGEMRWRGLWIFSHTSPNGDAPAHQLFDGLTIPPLGRPARQFDDYRDRLPILPVGRWQPVDGGVCAPLQHMPSVTVTAFDPNRTPADPGAARTADHGWTTVRW